MATYKEWNAAIVNYFTNGVAKGAQVFLSIDDNAIEDIGHYLLNQSPEDKDWVADYINAVKEYLVNGEWLDLAKAKDYDGDLLPIGVAFLGTMVLAASRMAMDEEIRDTNYFVRLRQVLGLPDNVAGRPQGLQPAGIEEPIWKAWNQWLLRNGWLTSAEGGNNPVYKFINYPLSQVLLREGDKERLASIFRTEYKAGHLGDNWGRETVSSWIAGAQVNSHHIKNLLHEPNPVRYEAILDMIYEVYSDIDWQSADVDGLMKSPSASQRRIVAGVLRHCDNISDSVTYYIYPKQPSRLLARSIYVMKDGSEYPLLSDRPGWFQPMWRVNLGGGMVYPTEGDARIREMVLPEKSFWILVRDPYNIDNDIFATWGKPELGETFLLVCQQEYQEQMKLFREEGLINWDHSYSFQDGEVTWTEYRECMVLSMDWEGVLVPNQDLIDALRPIQKASVLFKGGLKIGHQSGWLEGYFPQFMVVAFVDVVFVQIMNSQDPDNPVYEGHKNTNKYILMEALPPGNFLIQILLNDAIIARKTFRVLSWDQTVEEINHEIGADGSEQWYCNPFAVAEEADISRS